MYRILLIEDDYTLTEEIRKHLISYGYEVSIIQDFHNIINEFLKVDPALILLDIMLPFTDGYYVCREIRKISQTPIIYISSASENMNIVMACSCGGDDFISKPFDSMVLTAKISALLRRTYEMNREKKIVQFYGTMLDISAHQIITDEKTVELTNNEFKILETLLNNRGKIVGRDTLMYRLWQNDLYVEENTLSVNVGRLRKKLEECGLTEIIQTKSGSGYIIL